MRGRDDASLRYRRFRLLTPAPKRGVALGWVCLALVSIIGLVGMAFDVGTLEVAAQRCQEVADSAALGAAAELPSGAVTPVALGIASANNIDGSGWPVTLTAENVNVYGPGASVGGITLGMDANAVEVTVTTPVEFRFIRLLGLRRATVRRTAIAARSLVTSGFPYVPIWIDEGTAWDAEHAPGKTVDILPSDGSCYKNVETGVHIPGAFGFLEPPPGVSFQTLIAGDPLTEAQYNSLVSNIGDTVSSKPGMAIGHWRSQLLARIEAGDTGIYDGDNAASFHPGNPRLIVTVLVTYIGGGGSNAIFRVDGYVAFFLDRIVGNGANSEIRATFVDYYIPGDATWGIPTYDGFYSAKLIV
jgi:hypothetical protein